jgi:hypothetical protein
MSAIMPAADRQKTDRQNSRPHADEVELFAGIQQGKLEVKLIPRDDTQCQVLVTNKTDKPLSVKLPASFAGVPVLAQPAFPPNPMNPNGRNPNPFGSQPTDSKTPQRVGGGQQQNPFGFANIPPEAMRKVKLETVCLDYGHPRPRPEMKYEIRPVSAATDKAGVAEICEMLGRHEISHRAAQLAAWHFSNDMSWESLAALRTKQAIGTSPSYTKAELAAAKKAAQQALELHQKRQQPDAGKPQSANQGAS